MKLFKKYIILIVGSFFLASLVGAQENIDTELKQQLDSILYTDQTLRELFDNDISAERKSKVLKEFGYTQEDFEKRSWGIIANHDSLNLIEIEGVINRYGYPGKTLVGEPTNEAAWYVIQHSSKIEKYFPIIQKAGQDAELSQRLVAMMQDRMLTNQGKEQIYGTQVAGRKMDETDEWFQYVWPIKNPENVNKRRKQLGFKLTVEENAKRLGVDYKVYTLTEIDSILNPK